VCPVCPYKRNINTSHKMFAIVAEMLAIHFCLVFWLVNAIGKQEKFYILQPESLSCF